jgi:hypothetical protein
MARRNLLRSLLAASLLASALLSAVLSAPPPAGAADANLYQVNLSERGGFSPGVTDVHVGDYIAFVLDTRSSATNTHSVTWDDTNPCPGDTSGVPCWPELRFNDDTQSCRLRNYVIPNTRCVVVREVGAFRYHDRLFSEAGGQDFQGLVRVAGPSTGPPTTATTAPPTTTTRPVTTTTAAPTTSTTSGGEIHPFVVSSPPPSPTTTTTQPAAPAVAAGSDAGATGTRPAAAPKDQSKPKKADAPATSTTMTAPPPPGPSVSPIVDAAALAMGPVTLPDSVSSADEEAAGVDGVLGLIHHDQPADDSGGTVWMLLAFAGVGLLLTAGGVWTWLHRSSRYFPA